MFRRNMLKWVGWLLCALLYVPLKKLLVGKLSTTIPGLKSLFSHCSLPPSLLFCRPVVVVKRLIGLPGEGKVLVERSRSKRTRVTHTEEANPQTTTTVKARWPYRRYFHCKKWRRCTPNSRCSKRHIARRGSTISSNNNGRATAKTKSKVQQQSACIACAVRHA